MIKKQKILQFSGILALLLFSFLFLPYVTVIVALSFSVIFFLLPNKVYINEKIIIFLFFVVMFLVSDLFIATKTLNPFMNDKVNYWIYMKRFYGTGWYDWIVNYKGYDIFSYFMFKLSSDLFGYDNLAFSFFYFVSFAFIFIGGYRLIGKPIVLAMFMFIPQYNYEGLYGNLLRQSLALSIFIFALSNKSLYKRVLFGFLAFLSHFSYLIYIPLLYFFKKIKTIRTHTCFVIYLLSYLIGGFVFPVFMSYLGGLNTFFLSRVDAYDAGVFGNDIHRKIFVTSIFCIAIEVLNLFKNKLLKEGIDVLDKIRNCAIYTICIFLLTISFQEVANRYSVNIMAFFMLYVSFYAFHLKEPVLRLASLYLMAAGSIVVYFYINDVGVQFFYFGDLKSLTTDNIINVFEKVFL
ncbi:EpsG family protein [Tatumella terrea]|uniref:EpsG family protein n=1 Tax=Tatumella terrea TaxID=419007 RepID=UPI0031DAA14D